MKKKWTSPKTENLRSNVPTWSLLNVAYLICAVKNNALAHNTRTKFLFGLNLNTILQKFFITTWIYEKPNDLNGLGQPQNLILIDRKVLLLST